MNKFQRINGAIQYGIANDCVHFHISLGDVHKIAEQNMDIDKFATASNVAKFIASMNEIEQLFLQALNFIESNEFRDEYPNVNKIYMISPLVSKHKVQRMLEKYGFEIRDFSQMGKKKKY